MKKVNKYTNRQANTGLSYLFTCLLIYSLAACSAKPELDQLKIAISPVAQPVSAALAACIPQDEGLNVTIDLVYPSQIELSSYDIYIRLGDSEPEGFAAQIASERIVAAFQPGSELATLGRTSLAELFAGRGQQDAALWVAPESDEVRRAYEEQILHGSVSGAAQIASHPQALMDAVAADPQAAGLLPAAWANTSVQTIDLGINLPVLVIAAAEPTGAARTVLACLQGTTGQTELAKIYTPLGQ